MKQCLPHSLLLSLAVFAATMLIPDRAEAQCTHLGGSVNCPPGVPTGSSSLFFNPDGSITFTGGIVVPGTFVFMPFMPTPPTVTTPPPTTSMPSASGSGASSPQPTTGAGQASLTAPSSPLSIDDFIVEPDLRRAAIDLSLRAANILIDVGDFQEAGKIMDRVLERATGEIMHGVTEGLLNDILDSDLKTAGTPETIPFLPGLEGEGPLPAK